MALSQNLQDYLEAAGSQIGPLRHNRYQPALAVGLESAIGGAGVGIGMHRALDEARRLRASHDQFEAKTGIPYDLFARLSDQAQTQILQNTGFAPDPMAGTPEGFGGRTLHQLYTEGAPSPTAEVPGGSGIFEGTPSAQVETGPPMAPLQPMSGTERAKAMNAYLQGAGGGAAAGMTPAQQSLADYRDQLLGIRRTESGARMDYLRSGTARNEAQTGAIKALTRRRSEPDQPIDDWELDVATRMGMSFPKGVRPTRKQFTDQLKYNRSALAVVNAIDEATKGALEAEAQLGHPLTDKQIEQAITQNGTSLQVLGGPNAMQIVIDAVKKSIALNRDANQTIWNQPADGADEEQTEPPGTLEENEGESDPGAGEDYQQEPR